MCHARDLWTLRLLQSSDSDRDDTSKPRSRGLHAVYSDQAGNQLHFWIWLLNRIPFKYLSRVLQHHKVFGSRKSEGHISTSSTILQCIERHLICHWLWEKQRFVPLIYVLGIWLTAKSFGANRRTTRCGGANTWNLRTSRRPRNWRTIASGTSHTQTRRIVGSAGSRGGS
jgi:hypothetical protein